MYLESLLIIKDMTIVFIFHNLHRKGPSTFFPIFFLLVNWLSHIKVKADFLFFVFSNQILDLIFELGSVS